MSAASVAAWEAMFRAQVRVLRVLNAEFPDDGLSFNEYDVMVAIAREPGREIRMRELTRNVLLSQPSVSRLVERLVSRGVLSKRNDPRDARGAIVGVTAAGAEIYGRVAREHAAAIRRHVGGALSEQELAQLRDICVKLQAAMPDVAPAGSRSIASSPNS